MCEGPWGHFYPSLVLLSFCYDHPPRGRTSQPKGEELSFCHDRPKGFPIVPLYPNFCLGRPKRGFRPSGFDSFISRVCKGREFEGFNLRVHCLLSPSRSCVCCSPFVGVCSFLRIGGAGVLNLSGLVCALEFNLVEARMRALKQTRLGSVHLPGDARRTHVRRSRHLPFYDPKVEGRQVTQV
ncbi:hypothetical protein CRG98_027325 [Punica granatum]|uniref:Uncharacterized protein n=1 Tax=Punica granatum TaxID=22663 RepID=A0A2I0J8D4_PUNGR|nr:hypothetical protein CRG98_027325 [Punica granatum]